MHRLQTCWLIAGVLGAVGCGASPSGHGGGGGGSGDASAPDGGDRAIGMRPREERPSGCDNASGSRLRMQYYRTEDGATQFAGWKDTLLDESCSPGFSSDGQRRCLPRYLPASRYYRDAACMEPVALRKRDLIPCVTYKYAGLSRSIDA